jgi:hypothetical protein
MSATNIAVVYGADSKVIRRVSASDTDAELERAVGPAPGEAVLMMASIT